jgi:hypothetical protein
MDPEILDEISKNKDKIYLVTKKAGEEGEKNVWGPILIQGEVTDDIKQNIEEVLELESKSSKGMFKGFFGAIISSIDIKSSLIMLPLISLLITSGYYKYHHVIGDGYINNKDSNDSNDSEKDNIENFENLNEYQESKHIDWLIFILSIANIAYALKSIIGPILFFIFKIVKWVLGKTGTGAVGLGTGLGKGAVGLGTGLGKGAVGLGTGLGKGAVGLGEGAIGIGKGALGKVAGAVNKKNKGIKIRNPLEQEGGGKIGDGSRWIFMKFVTNIPSLVQLLVGIYFLQKSHGLLFP